MEWNIDGHMPLLKTKDVESSCKITRCLDSEKVSLAIQIVKAEVKFACFLLEHYRPIASTYHAKLLFRSKFPNSKVAQ